MCPLRKSFRLARQGIQLFDGLVMLLHFCGLGLRGDHARLSISHHGLLLVGLPPVFWQPYLTAFPIQPISST